MFKVIIPFVVTVLILLSCSEERIVQPPPSSFDIGIFCDTCGNDLPVSREDSVTGSYPPLLISTATKLVTYSPSKRYIAGEFFYNGITPSYGGFSVFIYDIELNRPVALFNNRFKPYWSSDGSKLSMHNLNYQSTEIYYMQTGELRTLITPVRGTGTHWSLDGNYIFLKSDDSLYRVHVEKNVAEFISVDIPTNQVFELDSSTILYRYDLGYIINHYKEKRKKFFTTHLASGFLETDLSPDRNKLLVMINQKEGNDPGTYGLYTIDIKTRVADKIIDNTRFRPEFYPRWGSNNTILVSLFCRNDNSYTTWEIDLKGKLLKRLTYYGMKLWL